MPGILDQIKQLRADEEAARASESVANRVPSASIGTKSILRSGVIPTRESVIGAPSVRTGENSMGSRSFSYAKALGMITGAVRAEHARVELEVMDEFTKSMKEHYPDWSPMPGCFLIPLSASLLPERTLAAVKSFGFVDNGADPDEIAYYNLKSMGTLNRNLGGALVPNPAYGDIIRLARNVPGLFSAGCGTIPIPPQGAIDFPRITSATSVNAIDGEGDTITESDLGTDVMKLEAKMVGGICTISNKLLMMSNPAAEQIVQEDLMLSVLLQFDYFGLFGRGGIEPTGIINQAGVQKVTPSTVGANGDTLQPQDWFNLFWTAAANANRQFSGWLVNPRSYASTVTNRTDAVTAGDGKGLFTVNPFMPFGRLLEEWFGYKVTATNQVKKTGTKGTATNLTYAFGGPWADAVVGLFGAAQVLVNPYESTAYSNASTKIRVTGLGDFGLKYPAAFSYAEKLTN
jgi:HK97 family phage major capsid protein